VAPIRQTRRSRARPVAEEVPVATIAAEIASLVERDGALPLTDVKRRASKARLLAVYDQITSANLEIGRSFVRRPLEAQLEERVRADGPLPLRGVEAKLRGATQREASAAATSLVERGRVRLVVRGKEVLLSRLDSPTLDARTRERLAALATELLASLRLASRKGASILRSDLERALAPFVATSTTSTRQVSATFDDVAALVDAHRESSGLTSVPKLVRLLGGEPAREAVHAELLRGSASGPSRASARERNGWPLRGGRRVLRPRPAGLAPLVGAPHRGAFMSTIRPAGGHSSPFENNHADPWAKTFIDLPELNANVTDAIVKAITTVRTAGRRATAALRTSSLLVLGPAGAGKTHLFARLRHRLGPKAVFVHLRPLVGTEMTPRYVLGQIVQQLSYETMSASDVEPPGSGLKQLEALVGSSLAQLEGASPEWPRIFLDEVAQLDDRERAAKLEWAVERLLQRHQEADDTYLARLLETPFMRPVQQRAALAWLGGRELEEAQMKRLGVSTALPEERIIQSLQTLGVFAAPGAPIVLVFDQLENLMDAEATGSRVRAYANLVAELFDATRGYVLVQMALDSHWERALLPELSEAQKTRLGSQKSLMELPTRNQARELVRRWIDHLPERSEPFPWPFGERRVEHWASTPGMTPRMLMIACRQALALGPDAPFEEPTPSAMAAGASSSAAAETDDDALAAAWEEHMKSAREALDEAAKDRRSADPSRLVGGMAHVFRFIADAQTSRVDARQHIQLLARVGAAPCAIALLHQTHPRAVGAALDRAAESVAKARTIAIRERALEFPPTWKKIHSALGVHLAKGLAWLTLERDDTARLLALESFLAASRSKDLEDGDGKIFEEAAVHDWIARTLAIADWTFGRAVTSGATADTGGHEQPVDASSASGSLRPVDRDANVARGATEAEVTIRACLTQLRVSSLERLVREVARVSPSVSRAEIVKQLDAMSSVVRWFGRAIVVLREEEAR
jgi:hypothetical protein